MKRKMVPQKKNRIRDDSCKDFLIDKGSIIIIMDVYYIFYRFTTSHGLIKYLVIKFEEKTT